MFKFFLDLVPFFEKIKSLFNKGHDIYNKAEVIKDEIKHGHIRLSEMKSMITDLKQEIKEKHPDKFAQLEQDGPQIG